jgi:hypothetical protein
MFTTVSELSKEIKLWKSHTMIGKALQKKKMHGFYSLSLSLNGKKAMKSE